MGKPLKAIQLRGCICALITPFDEFNEVDMDAMEHLFALHDQAQTQGLVIAGSTGESVALSEDEYADIMAFTGAHLPEGVHFIAGTGTPNTQKTITNTLIAAKAGAVAALVVTPAYARPTQLGLLLHYQAIADASPIPIILYNVPTRTGVDLLPETVAKLCVHPNIIGIKEARTDDQRIVDLVSLEQPDFVVLSGDDAHAVRAIELGARGLISVTANVRPEGMRQMVEYALARDMAGAQLSRRELIGLIDAMGVEPNPIPVKFAAAELGLCGPTLRLPLTELSFVHREMVRQELKQTIWNPL